MEQKKNDRFHLLLMLLGAAMTALTMIFPQVGLLEWISMIPMIVGVYRLCEDNACSLRKAYGYGFLTVYVFYLFNYHWIVNLYPLDFVGLDAAASVAVIAAGWLGLPLLQAVIGGFVFLLFRLLHKNGLFEKVPFLRPFVFASLWVVFEWSATLHWTGVPWGRLCIGQSNLLPILQSASLFGSYFVTWLLVAVNALLAYAVLYQIRSTLCATVAAALFFSNLFFGAVKYNLPVSDKGEDLCVAVIQGNINSHEKWDKDSFERTKQIYGEYTRKAASMGAELVVWPETVIVNPLNRSVSAQKFVSSLARECNVTLIVGSIYYIPEEANYNALFLVDPDGTIHMDDFYAKRHLVPFGEYVPLRRVITTLIPPLAELSALGEDLMPGQDSQLFETEWGSIGSLICFDSIYEQLTLDSVRDGAELLILSSNDSWFFDSAGVYQHHVQAKLRAIESGKYLVRAGNTGISSIITPNGIVHKEIEPLVDGFAVSNVRMIRERTLYTVLGNSFVYLCIAFYGGALLYGTLLDRKKKKGSLLSV